MTAVAAFNAVVIGLGALVLGVPEAGASALVNFLAAYIPYLGAWTAGAFTVLVALGSEGTSTAIAMAVIVLLASGGLQQLIQPIAYRAALGIHPLAVLIVTIAGGALFGTIGLVLGAPLTSAAVHVSSDLALARAREPRLTGGASDAGRRAAHDPRSGRDRSGLSAFHLIRMMRGRSVRVTVGGTSDQGGEPWRSGRFSSSSSASSIPSSTARSSPSSSA